MPKTNIAGNRSMNMSSCQRSASGFRKLVAPAVVGAILTSGMIAAPASASPPGDLWNLVNAAHVAAGCQAYTEANQVNDVALQFAKTMAFNSGRAETTSFAVGVDQLLAQRGYSAGSWGSMNFFNPGGGSAQAASAFWQSQGTNDLIRNCGMAQLGIAVWINGSNWAASGVVATPDTTPADNGPGPVVK
jgi:hypothetical protein